MSYFYYFLKLHLYVSCMSVRGFVHRGTVAAGVLELELQAAVDQQTRVLGTN